MTIMTAMMIIAGTASATTSGFCKMGLFSKRSLQVSQRTFCELFVQKFLTGQMSTLLPNQ